VSAGVKEGLAGDVRHRGHDARPTRNRSAGCTRRRFAPAPRVSASPTRWGTPRRPARAPSCASCSR
jgi:hypothetical protein